jgi:hypothetical protein
MKGVDLNRKKRRELERSKPKIEPRKEIQAIIDNPPKNFDELQKLKIPHGVITLDQWAKITRKLREP